jgi:hypothetical protein
MQQDLGNMGVFAKYKPPHANYMLNDYPVLVNMLPELHRAASDEILSGRIASGYATTIQEVMDRYDGELERGLKRVEEPLGNPLMWFREGIDVLLSAPRSILTAFGVLPEASAAPRGRLSAVIGGIVTLVTFASGLVTIATGWDAFRAFIATLIPVGP